MAEHRIFLSDEQENALAEVAQRYQFEPEELIGAVIREYIAKEYTQPIYEQLKTKAEVGSPPDQDDSPGKVVRKLASRLRK